MDSTSVCLLALFVYFVLVPAATYLHVEAKHRHRWRRRWLVDVPEPAAPGGPFRDDEGMLHPPHRYVAERSGAPCGVKVTVVTSLVLGHVFVPGLLVGLGGVAIYGLGLVSIPGLWLAAASYRNAFGLLRCEPKAAAWARELRGVAIVFDVAVLAIAALIAVVAGLHPLLLLPVVYAGISLLHAEGLGRAADAIDAVQQDVLGGTTLDGPIFERGRAA